MTSGVVHEYEVRGLPSHLGAVTSHRNADVRAAQGGCVVDSVARHRHDLAAFLPGLDDPQLLLRPGAGEHSGFGQPGGSQPALEFSTGHDLVGPGGSSPPGTPAPPRCRDDRR
jgi:hypothetical protein